MSDTLRPGEPTRTTLADRSSAAGARAWLARLSRSKSFEETRLQAHVDSLDMFDVSRVELVDGANSSAIDQLRRLKQVVSQLSLAAEALPWDEALREAEPQPPGVPSLKELGLGLLVRDELQKLHGRASFALRFLEGDGLPESFGLLMGVEEWAEANGLELTGVLVAMVEIATGRQSPVSTSQELDARGRPWRKEIELWRASPERAAFRSDLSADSSE